MKANDMHQLIDNKGDTGHVTGIFHQGDEQKQDQDIRQKYDHTPHTPDDPVDNEIIDDAIRND